MYIAEWQPAMVPGLVQTAAYARELFERPDRPTLIDPGDADPEAMATGRALTCRPLSWGSCRSR